MSESPVMFNLLQNLLPVTKELEVNPMGEVRRLYAGVGLPSLRVAEVQMPGSCLPPAIQIQRFSEHATIRQLCDAPAFLAHYRVLRRKALQGDVDAINDLGWLWLNGHMLEPDYACARKLFKLAIAEGSSEALFNLAEQYYYGKGIAVDLHLAADYYRLAYDAGLVPAARMLGDIYEVWHCRELEDPYLVAEWYRRAAEGGDLEAAYLLGCHLLKDGDFTHDEPSALYWLQHTALHGHAAAAERLAEFFEGSVDYGPKAQRLAEFWRRLEM